MGLNVSSITNPTDADIVKAYRWALLNMAAGQTRTFDGRTITFPPVADMIQVINAFSTDTSGGIALGTFE